ncbi:hypothetical protein BaRGS_00012715 [Batillaria attramentaria]|uniref:Uncharacterized protein n=1 Tax=Batillaria attramentaria TaxID=370345 RepID=A0ABD0LA48_9CAEN
MFGVFRYANGVAMKSYLLTDFGTGGAEVMFAGNIFPRTQSAVKGQATIPLAGISFHGVRIKDFTIPLDPIHDNWNVDLLSVLVPLLSSPNHFHSSLVFAIPETPTCLSPVRNSFFTSCIWGKGSSEETPVLPTLVGPGHCRFSCIRVLTLDKNFTFLTLPAAPTLLPLPLRKNRT